MNKSELLNIIQQGENETVEFKKSFSKAVIETIVAFSNQKGGKILIGVNDKKEIIGVILTEETIQKWINEIKQNTEPSVFPDFETIEIDSKITIIISVDEFPLKPISFKDSCFIRKKNSNHKLSIDEIAEIRFINLMSSHEIG